MIIYNDNMGKKVNCTMTTRLLCTSDRERIYERIFSTGGYAYIDSESPRLAGDTARLVSEVIQSREEPLCFHFWVNMHGGGLGTLR